MATALKAAPLEHPGDWVHLHPGVGADEVRVGGLWALHAEAQEEPLRPGQATHCQK